MRKVGLQIIKLISLIRYFSFGTGVKIFGNLLFGIKDFYLIKSGAFKNEIYLRREQSDPHIFEQVFIEQQYRFDYLPESQVKWIIDAGANIGLAAIFFATKYPQAKIISIEPDAANFELLKKNTLKYPGIIPINAALWYKKEILDISNKEEFSAGYMMTPSQNINNASGPLIEAVTVTELIEKYNIEQISILKIDIEGSEKEVFQFDADKWIEKTAVIITELHDWLKPGTSQVYFNTMSAFDWVTYVKGENIICIKN